jgi:glycerol-3-phosphate acyltransferase PlsY
MQAYLIAAGWVLGAYLLGSLSFAIIVSRLMGLADPRHYGSKNPGATNVLRSGNKAAAIITLLLDGAKGWAAVFAAQRFGVSDNTLALVALAVFLGHLYPLYFRFAGGKGVATALGVLLAVNLWLGLATLAVWVLIAAAFRFSSLASIVSAVFASLAYMIGIDTDAMALAIIVMTALLVYRHRGNIAKLMAGKESRIGGSAAKRQEKPHHG